jgi:hypothetical protein
MSIFAAGPHSPVVVRAAEAEYLPDIGTYLLADSSATHGALSTHRVQLGRGQDGAVPHRHTTPQSSSSWSTGLSTLRHALRDQRVW